MVLSAGFRSFGTQCDIEIDDTPPLLNELPKQAKKKGAPQGRFFMKGNTKKLLLIRLGKCKEKIEIRMEL